MPGFAGAGFGVRRVDARDIRLIGRAVDARLTGVVHHRAKGERDIA
jgi:hypothetical protein